MKLRERVFAEDGKIIVQETYDAEPAIERVKMLREAPGKPVEGVCIGSVPLWLLEMWCKEDGVRWDDVHARREVMKKRLANGDFAKLRVDGGIH